MFEAGLNRNHRGSARQPMAFPYHHFSAKICWCFKWKSYEKFEINTMNVQQILCSQRLRSMHVSMPNFFLKKTLKPWSCLELRVFGDDVGMFSDGARVCLLEDPVGVWWSYCVTVLDLETLETESCSKNRLGGWGLCGKTQHFSCFPLRYTASVLEIYATILRSIGCAVYAMRPRPRQWRSSVVWFGF